MKLSQPSNTTSSYPYTNIKSSAAWVFVFAILFPVCGAFWSTGKSAAEKLVTTMAQPLFVIILVVVVIGIELIRRGQRHEGRILLAGSACLWVASSRVLVDPLFHYWEQRVPSAALASSDTLDYLVVLGGGSSMAYDGRAQFGESGDRIAFAACLFLEGRVKHLVTTGDSLHLPGTANSVSNDDQDPSLQTIQLWSKLGIPASAISEIPGENTSAEIAALKTHPEWWRDKRCGLLTSAFHMPRAMRLAESNGINVSPINADFRTAPSPLLVKDFYPDARNLYRLQILWKEWLGILIGR